MPLVNANAIPQDWRTLLDDFFATDDWLALQVNIQNQIALGSGLICPEPIHFFKALSLTPLSEVKVVIIGQDPYHSPGLAQGLAFSIPGNIPTGSKAFPSSLRNISKALALEGFGNLPDGDLHFWASQGVLLLNTALSVRQGEAGSHANLGWKPFIDYLIHALAHKKPHLVWMLWGGHAQSKLPLIESGADQRILQSSHPSGLGVYKTAHPFLQPGAQASCGHFTKANEWLTQHGETPINWVDSAGKNSQETHQTDLFG
jgi:uracil-DNA glycosylase